MKIQHASAPHLGRDGKLTPAQAIPVYEVRSPDDEEAAFLSQMETAKEKFAEQPTAGVPLLSEDPIVQQEVKKQATLDVLNFLRKEHTVEVELGGAKFKLKLLDSHDQAYVVKIMRDYAPAEGYKLSFMTLAAAIVSINDMPLEDFYEGEAKIENPIIKKYYQVNKWNAQVTTMLMGVYNAFQNEIEQGYTKDFLVK